MKPSGSYRSASRNLRLSSTDGGLAGISPVKSSFRFGDRWRHLRDLLLSNRQFQRWAVAFPLTRPIARRRAADLFDLCAGFVYSQVLVACVRMRLFQQLQPGPLAATTLATRSGMPLDAIEMLLEAAASLRLLERRGPSRYGLGPLGAALLGNPGLGAMVEHHAALYADLADPVALLRGEIAERKLASYWPYVRGQSERDLGHEAVTPYTTLMSASQPMVAELVLGAYPFGRHRCLLDVGGGDGTFLTAVASAAPGLQLQLFDLPEVAAIARDRFATAGLAARASASGGSFLCDPLPRGADVISLIRVVHDHDDESVLALFAAVRAALPPGGTIVIGEPMAGQAGTEAISAYFQMYLHTMGSGQLRSFAAVRDLLTSAGFTSVRLRKTRIPMIASVVVAQS